jgi:hypothetical protein
MLDESGTNSLRGEERMSPWIPVTISTSIAVVSIAERFYSRFIPDIETQKRHLKRAGKWTTVLILFGIQLGNIIYLIRIPGPPTKAWVLQITVSVGAFVFCLASLFDQGIMQLLDKMNSIDGRTLDGQGKLIDVQGKLINLQGRLTDSVQRLTQIADSHQRAMTMLASHSREIPPDLLKEIKSLIEDPNEPK